MPTGALPEGARVVALVYDAAQGPRGAELADAIARTVAGEREHTLLASAADGPSPLDQRLGGGTTDGLPGALEGRVRLTDVAVHTADRPFVYLPAGRDPVAMRTLLRGELFASFVERVRERGGTLLLLVPPDALEESRVRELVDGYLALGEVTIGPGDDGVPALGRIGLPDPSTTEAGRNGSGAAAQAGAEPEPEAEPEPDAEAEGGEPGQPAVGDAELGEPGEREAAGADDVRGPRPRLAEAAVELAVPGPESSSWRRHRAKTGFPVRRAVVTALALAALFASWWLIAGVLRPVADSSEGPTMSAPGEEVIPSSRGPEATATEDEGGVPPSGADAAAIAEAAPELPYSVLIASFAARTDAEERLARLRQRDGTRLYYTAPTPVRGAIYHRVFAGAVAGQDEAMALMGELVERGLKDGGSEWDVRPVRLAFRLGMFSTREDADDRVAAVAGAGIPAYVVRAGAGGAVEGTADDRESASVYLVYAGAYEGPRSAAPMAELIEEAGEKPILVTRRGGFAS